MSAVITTEERIKSVRVEGLALLKIVKHCHESLPQMVTGSLLGLETGDGVLEITHSFSFPPGDDDDNFQMEMMRMLREVNVDNNCVGWYQSMYLGSYSTNSLMESQFQYQTDLSANAVVLLYDPMQTSHGNLVLKCLRLTEACVELKKSGKNQYLSSKEIFEEVPIEYANPGLVRALLADVQPNLDTSLDRLDLSTNPYLEKHLEFLCSWVDDLAAEQHKFQYYTRNTRGRQRKEQHEPWNSGEAPKRLESLLMANQIDTYCEQVNKFAGGGFGKLFLAGGLHKEEDEE
jgi:translation initiation factor 3 subunit H